MGKTGEKKLKNYFFEFLMLFLAVTLGFFAENQRENYTERQLEKQYVTSMLEDLLSDTLQFHKAYKERLEIISMCDSLTTLLRKEPKTTHDLQRLHYMSRLVIFYTNTFLFNINDRTFDQMRSSGNLRLIREHRIGNLIGSYYFRLKQLAFVTEHGVLRAQQAIELQGKIFNGAVYSEIVDMKKFVFRMPTGRSLLVTEDKKIINEFVMSLHYLASQAAFTSVIIRDMNVQANNLIVALNEEYAIE